MKSVQILCDKLKYREFPELLFGQAPSGIVYCDISAYLKKKGDYKKHSLANFKQKFDEEIGYLIKAYDLNPEEVFLIEQQTGNLLIDESLVFLYVEFIDPMFHVYTLERMEEMFINGIALSDTYIYTAAKDRLNKEQLMSALSEG